MISQDSKYPELKEAMNSNENWVTFKDGELKDRNTLNTTPLSSAAKQQKNEEDDIGQLFNRFYNMKSSGFNPYKKDDDDEDIEMEDDKENKENENEEDEDPWGSSNNNKVGQISSQYQNTGSRYDSNQNDFWSSNQNEEDEDEFDREKDEAGDGKGEVDYDDLAKKEEEEDENSKTEDFNAANYWRSAPLFSLGQLISEM